MTARTTRVLGTMALDAAKMVFAPFAFLLLPILLILLVLVSPILWYLDAEKRTK